MSPAVCQSRFRMRIVISEFISLDGVVQAPGGRQEDTDGGFQHGGWSMRFFDPEVMGSASTRRPNEPTRSSTGGVRGR